MSSSKNTKILNVVPVDELKTLITTYPEVLLEVRQRVANGKFRQVVSKSVSMSPSSCYSGELESWLKQKWGGGEYEISVWDPQDPGSCVAPRWRLILPGAPIMNPDQPGPFGQQGYGQQQHTPYNPYAPATPYAPQSGLPGAGHPHQQHGPTPFGAGMAPGAPGFRPPQAPGYPPGYVPHLPGMGAGASRMGSDGPGNGASMYSDQVAHGWAERTDGRLQAAQNENRRLQEQLIAMERQSAQQAVQGQIEALRIQMQQSQQQQQQQGGRGPDWGSLLAGLGAVIGPLATAFLHSSSSRSSNEIQAQIRQMELNQQNQQAMLAVAQKQPQNQLGEILPAVVPPVMAIIGSMLEQKSPQAQVEANLATQQMQMAQAKMIMDFIDRETGPDGDRPWWAPMLEGMLMGGMELVEAARQGQFGGQQPQTIQNQAPGQPQPSAAQRAAAARHAQAAQQGQVDDGPHAYDMYPWEDLAKRDQKAAMVTRMIFTKIPEEAGFHTREWQVLIFNLHAGTNPEQVADALVSHLESCAKLGQLPTAFKDVFEDPTILRDVLEHFPVYSQDREYAEEVLRIALGRLTGRYEDVEDVDDPAQAAPEVPGAETAATVPSNGAGHASPAPEATTSTESEDEGETQEREPVPAAAGAVQ